VIKEQGDDSLMSRGSSIKQRRPPAVRHGGPGAGVEKEADDVLIPRSRSYLEGRGMAMAWADAGARAEQEGRDVGVAGRSRLVQGRAAPFVPRVYLCAPIEEQGDNAKLPFGACLVQRPLAPF
jgi:hypothetical protein